MVSSDDASLGDQECIQTGEEIDDIDKDAEITLIDETQRRYGDDLMFDTSVLDDEEVFAGQDMDEKEINVLHKSFDREDLETLWKLVKAKHGSTRPEEGYKRVLWGDLKIMFDPHVEDQVWRNQQDYRVLDWKIYDSCRVHSLRIFLNFSQNSSRINEVFRNILLVINEAFNEETCDFEGEYQVKGRIVGIKRLHDDLEVTATKVCVTVAKLKLVLFINSNEKYAK
ncbi:hypothetical protein Tco_0406912 [Tanacetum coccineum]